MQTPSFQKSVHVIRGDSAAGSLRQAWGRDLIILRDPLCPGPCHTNPARHRHERAAFLRGYGEGIARRNRRSHASFLKSLAQDILSADELLARLSTFSPEKPVVLWTAVSWGGRLSLWWTLDALQRARLGLDRFWVAEPALPWSLGQLGAFRACLAASSGLRGNGIAAARRSIASTSDSSKPTLKQLSTSTSHSECRSPRAF